MIHKLKREVETVLYMDRRCRNSDIYLWVEIVKRFYKSHYEELCRVIRTATALEQTWPGMEAFMLEVPNQDNVKRIRAQFNARGKYMPTSWEVAKKRMLKQDEWKIALGYSVETPADHIERQEQQKHMKNL
jgi:hypothetical protein